MQNLTLVLLARKYLACIGELLYLFVGVAGTDNPAAVVRRGLIVDVVVFVQRLVDYELGGVATRLRSLPHLILFDELQVGRGGPPQEFIFLGLVPLTSIAI